MTIPGKYLIYLGAGVTRIDAKTGYGLVHWRPEMCVAQFSSGMPTVDLGVPEMTPEQARAAGAQTMVIGVAQVGGALTPGWIAAIVEALDAGLNVASGMHVRLASVPAIAQAAARNDRELYDVRHADRSFDVATGRKRSGQRLLTVGTDCAVGKKYAALAIAREMQRRGMSATFRATGQTGILISGAGVAIDAVVADFVAGAAEWVSPDAPARHWDIIEGQGSLFHPGYAGVSTALLHGSQPDAIVVCHDPQRTRIDGYEDFPIPALAACIDLNLRLAALTNPAARCVGISVNTSSMDSAWRRAYLDHVSRECAVPCVDPIATGAAAIVDFIQQGPASAPSRCSLDICSQRPLP